MEPHLSTFLLCCPKRFVFEQAEEYVKALEKSTSPLSTMREVFEHGVRNASQEQVAMVRSF